MFLSIDPQTNADLWIAPMDEGRGTVRAGASSVFLKTPFREVWSVFSPDGRWVAYQSIESGRPEIYVRPFVPPSRETADKPAAAGSQWQVSTAGGIMPSWRPDGKELYYLDPAGAMMAVPIVATASTIEPGAPAALFPTHIYGGGIDAQVGRQYDVAPDGRFLINTELDSAAAPITLLQNWNPDGKK
jgi:serine/threonine-protein kinase